MDTNIINLSDYRTKTKKYKKKLHKEPYTPRTELVEAEIITLLNQLIEISENRSNIFNKNSTSKAFTIYKNPNISNSKA